MNNYKLDKTHTFAVNLFSGNCLFSKIVFLSVCSFLKTPASKHVQTSFPSQSVCSDPRYFRFTTGLFFQNFLFFLLMLPSVVYIINFCIYFFMKWKPLEITLIIFNPCSMVPPLRNFWDACFHWFILSFSIQDFEKYENISEEWEEPKKAEYVDQGNLRSWLLEPDSCDQYR